MTNGWKWGTELCDIHLCKNKCTQKSVIGNSISWKLYRWMTPYIPYVHVNTMCNITQEGHHSNILPDILKTLACGTYSLLFWRFVHRYSDDTRLDECRVDKPPHGHLYCHDSAWCGRVAAVAGIRYCILYVYNVFFHLPDVNECASDNGGCDNVCKDTDGSYTCSCTKGLILSQDRHTCICKSV